MGSSDCQTSSTDESFSLPVGSAAFLPTTEVGGISPPSGDGVLQTGRPYQPRSPSLVPIVAFCSLNNGHFVVLVYEYFPRKFLRGRQCLVRGEALLWKLRG